MSTKELLLEILETFAVELTERLPLLSFTTGPKWDTVGVYQTRISLPKQPLGEVIHYTIILDGSKLVLMRVAQTHLLSRNKRELPDKGRRSEHLFDLNDPHCFEKVTARLEQYLRNGNEYPRPAMPTPVQLGTDGTN